jgi:flagellar basal-body rod protein FlgB
MTTIEHFTSEKSHCNKDCYNAPGWRHLHRERVVTGLMNTGLDFYRQVLELRGYRQEVLAADIANASTPRFKAVDLDFRQALDAAARDQSSQEPTSDSTPRWLVDDPRHQAPGGGGLVSAAASAVKYQIGNPVTLDGNSVDLNREKIAAAENAVQYEATAAFTSQTIRMLTVAINGSASQQSAGG